MPKKSAKNTKKTIKKKAVKAALELAAEKNWDNVTLEDIADKIKKPVEDLQEHFSDTTDILIELGRIIDETVLKAAGEPDPESSHRDTLFDIMMERFDVLNEYREGLTAILRSFRCDPKQAVTGIPHLYRSMNTMLDAAGIETEGIHGCAKVIGLTGVYLKTVHVWMDDDSKDMARTMAELDKNLGYAERAVSGLGI